MRLEHSRQVGQALGQAAEEHKHGPEAGLIVAGK